MFISKKDYQERLSRKRERESEEEGGKEENLKKKDNEKGVK